MTVALCFVPAIVAPALVLSTSQCKTSRASDGISARTCGSLGSMYVLPADASALLFRLHIDGNTTSAPNTLGVESG